MCVLVSCGFLMPKEARKGDFIPWIWDYRGLWGIRWVLGTESESFLRARHALILWASFLVCTSLFQSHLKYIWIDHQWLLKVEKGMTRFYVSPWKFIILSMKVPTNTKIKLCVVMAVTITTNLLGIWKW